MALSCFGRAAALVAALTWCLFNSATARTLLQANPSAMDMAKALIDIRSFQLVMSEPPRYSGPATAKLIQSWAASDAFEAELYPNGALKLATVASGKAQDAVLQFTVKAEVCGIVTPCNQYSLAACNSCLAVPLGPG
jgi:hypothetical protein